MIFIGCISCGKSKIGAIAGMISGLVAVGGARLVISLKSGFSAAAARSPEMGVAAMAVSLLVVPLVSVFTSVRKTRRSVRTKSSYAAVKLCNFGMNHIRILCCNLTSNARCDMIFP